ncbi:ATPase [Benzoatithermus flavus]|uniref:ATP synthase subunit b n=1 Tax=Benzoatithermus flavus TaxID=3108223 RepID=A0ABU8XMT1_9PROT
MGRLEPLLRHLRSLGIATAVVAALAAPVAFAETATQHGGTEAAAGTEHTTPGPHAAQAAVGAEAEHGAEGGEHQAGLPQLNTATYPSQIFWLIVAFATLYYLLSKRALPRVSEILEARQERIAADLDRAAALRAEAEEAMSRHQAVVAEAQARAAAAIKATQERIAAEMARRQAEVDADLDRKLAEAEARIRAARDAALAEVQNVAVEVAQAAVERLAGIKLAEAEVKAALDRVQREAA